MLRNGLDSDSDSDLDSMNMDPKHCLGDEYQIPSFCSDELSGLLAARVLSYSASWTNWSWSVFVLLIPFLFKLGLFCLGGGGGR